MAKIAPEPRFGANSVRRDLVRFGSAVLAAAAFSAVQVFVIPRRLELADYGHYRLFLLLVNYFGLLHFGLGDGAFLRWAGQPADLVAREWRQVTSWLLAIQAGILALAFGVAPFVAPIARIYLITVAVCAAFVNLAAVSSYALQAIGDFGRAGRALIVAPSLFIVSVLLVPELNLLTTLCCYVGSFAVAAAYAGWCVLRVPASLAADTPSVALRPLIVTGLPVLGASIAGGLSQSVDRLLVSMAVPISTFAIYGFAATASVAANSATQALSRVALSHAANRSLERRAHFLAGFLSVIALGYGTMLLGEPVFESLVARYLPAYDVSLPIVRALTVGLPPWVATHVVLVGTLQSYGLVRRQLAIELAGIGFVTAFCGVAILAHAPLWLVASSATAAGAATLITGTIIVRRAVPEAHTQSTGRFACVIVLQGAALLAALHMAATWQGRAGYYALLACIPTAIAARAVRRHDW